MTGKACLMSSYDIIAPIMDEILKKTARIGKRTDSPKNKKHSRCLVTPKGRISSLRSSHKHRYKKNNDENIEISLSLSQWEKIVAQQRYRCALCGEKFTDSDPPTDDLIIPVAKKGELTLENTQAVHKSCNSRKRDRIDKSNIVSWISRPDLCLDEIQMPY